MRFVAARFVTLRFVTLRFVRLEAHQAALDFFLPGLDLSRIFADLAAPGTSVPTSVHTAVHTSAAAPSTPEERGNDVRPAAQMGYI